MKQYNVVVRFPTKTTTINILRVAIPEDLEDNCKDLSNLIKPPRFRTKIHNCMDLMKATALKAGLIKCFKESGTECEIFIQELSDRLYRDLDTFNRGSMPLIKNPSPFAIVSTK